MSEIRVTGWGRRGRETDDEEEGVEDEVERDALPSAVELETLGRVAGQDHGAVGRLAVAVQHDRHGERDSEAVGSLTQAQAGKRGDRQSQL